MLATTSMPLCNTKLFVLLLVCTISSSVHAIDCLDGSNKPVAWWTKLKLPSSLGIAKHLYYDSSDDQSASTSFRAEDLKIDDEGSALYNTLNQINSYQRADLQILAFNDQFPNGKTYSSKAHAKGVIVFEPEKNAGFYIMHSTPKFPAIDDFTVSPKLPQSGWVYGQNYLCITIDNDGLSNILSSLSVSQPNVYYDNAKLAPLTIKQDSIAHTFKIRLNGQPITHISKSPKYEEYLYPSIISPHFNVHLAVESWSHPKEPSQCSSALRSVNVDSINFNNTIKWTIGQDHSKWAVSYEGGRKVVCASDMNRAASQKKRGGGALCFDGNSHLHDALTNLIGSYDQCATPNLRRRL